VQLLSAVEESLAVSGILRIEWNAEPESFCYAQGANLLFLDFEFSHLHPTPPDLDLSLSIDSQTSI